MPANAHRLRVTGAANSTFPTLLPRDGPWPASGIGVCHTFLVISRSCHESWWAVALLYHSFQKPCPVALGGASVVSLITTPTGFTDALSLNLRRVSQAILIPRGESEKLVGRTPRIGYTTNAGWSSLVARWAHNPKVAGSNPAPATNPHIPRFRQSLLRLYPLESACEAFSTGLSENPQKRLPQHNHGGRGWTARHAPWKLVHSERCDNYALARRRESQLKAQKHGTGFWTATGLDPSQFSPSSLGS